MLGYFKYYDFFVTSSDNLLSVVGLDMPLEVKSIVLPVGISFYTFMAISYVVDAYRGEFEPTTLEKFAVYLSFFPHLVAGPIVRPGELIPQLETPRDPRRVDTSRAFYLIATGLFKKVVIANYLASSIVDEVFAAPGQHSSLEILIAVYAYAVQIYADFSGYTDIAIGIALLLGFSFPQNFDSPYAATSLQDFWRRWHMTLSRWLRDYVYIPLGGNRGQRSILTYRNLMLTMLIGGLWHGAAGPSSSGARSTASASSPSATGRRATRAGGAAADHVAALARTAPHVPLRLLRLDLLPRDSFDDAWAMITGLFTALGRAVAARDRRRPARDRGRDRLAVPAGTGPAARDGAVLAAAGARPGDRPRVRADADERHGSRRRGTLHLLPVLMPDRPPPAAAAGGRAADGRAGAAAPPPTAPLPAAAAPRRRGGPTSGTPRRGSGARSRARSSRPRPRDRLLLNAPGIHKPAYNKPDGW